MVATSSSSSSDRDSTGAIIGGVVGGVVVLAAATFFVLKKRGVALNPAELQAVVPGTSTNAQDRHEAQKVDESKM